MFIEGLFGLGYASMCASMLFPDEIANLKKKAKKAVKITGKAAELTSEQMSASAYADKGGITGKRRLVKGYRNQKDARRHRIKMDVGTTVYLPNGTQITVEKGLKEVESEGWWYAWESF